MEELDSFETTRISREAGREFNPQIAAPPMQLHCPSMTRSPLLEIAPKTPRRGPLGALISASPISISIVKKAVSCPEEVGRLQDPQEAWLPITESREGNVYYSTFHSLNSGIGAQALVLPMAFVTLGWIWGIVCLCIAFSWQLYTMWLLIQLHESENGTRHSRYLRLSMAAFGPKLGKMLALFPLMYLSGGTCVALTVIGSESMKTFFEIVCGGGGTCNVRPLTGLEWYMLFMCLAILVAQLPNLNSIAGVSLIGAIAAVGYCTLIWVLSVVHGRPTGVSYAPPPTTSDLDKAFGILNALGIIAFAFRGHNLVLEIQGTMPSGAKQPCRLPMWRGVKFAYLIVAACLFPLAIGGYWAYGNLMTGNGGMLSALHKYHGQRTSKTVLGLTSLLIIISSLGSFQIYAMPVFDNFELRFTSKMNRPCPRWLRSVLRLSAGCLVLFISVALPFLPSLAGLLGGVALLVTLAYPCIMWMIMKRPRRYSPMWCLNLVLGVLGILLSVIVVTGAIWTIVTRGIEVHFFKPQ